MATVDSLNVPDPHFQFPIPVVRPATVGDVPAIKALIDQYAGPVLLEKTLVNLYEAIAEFRVVEVAGDLVACGALHVLWQDLAEIRTVAVNRTNCSQGLGALLCRALIDHARQLGIARIFCLTFQTRFFASLGFAEIGELDLSDQAYAELRSSYDQGVAEFLDLPFVKRNTLGNTRMLLTLD